LLYIKPPFKKLIKKWRGKPTLARGKNPPPPSTNGRHYMTFVLENKIKKKDLPILGLDNLGLPEMGNYLYIIYL